jgi:hypothetical protein
MVYGKNEPQESRTGKNRKHRCKKQTDTKNRKKLDGSRKM